MNKLILLPLLLAIFYCYIFYTFFIYNCSPEYYNFYIKKTISANHKEIELFKNNVLKTNILYNHNSPGLLLYKGWSHQG
ncbi:MAG: hypothetical protein K6G15_06145, partial [Desulfovibrio sp.]|nr:hypothetical protein [Desulfovibrio sp.]